MKIHNLIQGSPEWLAYRAQHFNASDAPAMMGCSPYKTRAELLRELHTGVVGEVDIATQKRFDNGHRVEALARPLAEEFIGAELYPVTGSNGRLSASFDGLTMDETEGFEHKALNAELRAVFKAMAGVDWNSDADAGRTLPLMYRVQMEQQLMVSGAERVLFMSSAWTGDSLDEEHHCWYYPDATLRGEILLGWDQFERDLAAYTPPPATEAAPVGKAPDTLPALRIEVTGAVTASNLAEFKATALGAIRSVNRTLKTDQDFADAEKAVKWCSDIESRLKAAKEHALSQTADIDALFKALDDIGGEARTVRLDLAKLVDRRKLEVKEEAVAAARKALDAHIADLNAEIAPMRLRPIAADFAGCIKGLKSVSSMQDKLDVLLATTKIAAEAEARAVRANVATFHEKAAGFEFLFADLGSVIHKAADDFAALLQARIATHQAAETARKAKREADEAAAKAAAEAQAALQAAAAPAPTPAYVEPAIDRLAREQMSASASAHAAQVAVQACRPGDRAMLATPAGAELVKQAAVALRDEPATLNLGAIGERLGFALCADFITGTLHITPAAIERGLPRFRESQFPLICSQLLAHVSAMGELYAGETA